MRIGLDTNILVYALDNSDAEKHEKAVNIVKSLFSQPTRYAIATQVLAETVYVVKRKYPAATPTAVKLVRLLQELPVLRILPYAPEDVLNASRHGAFWDALLAYTYVRAGVGIVLTENVGDYKDLPVEARNPFTP